MFQLIILLRAVNTGVLHTSEILLFYKLYSLSASTSGRLHKLLKAEAAHAEATSESSRDVRFQCQALSNGYFLTFFLWTLTLWKHGNDSREFPGGTSYQLYATRAWSTLVSVSWCSAYKVVHWQFILIRGFPGLPRERDACNNLSTDTDTAGLCPYTAWTYGPIILPVRCAHACSNYSCVHSRICKDHFAINSRARPEMHSANEWSAFKERTNCYH